MIFDDAVVHDGNAVERNVGVGIPNGRNAMGGPARVRDADRSRNGRRIEGVFQDFDLADRPHPRELPFGVQHGESR